MSHGWQYNAVWEALVQTMDQQARGEQKLKVLKRWFVISFWAGFIGSLCDTFPVIDWDQGVGGHCADIMHWAGARVAFPQAPLCQLTFRASFSNKNCMWVVCVGVWSFSWHSLSAALVQLLNFAASHCLVLFLPASSLLTTVIMLLFLALGNTILSYFDWRCSLPEINPFLSFIFFFL